MDLTPRQLAFLEHEMEQFIEGDRCHEDESHASSILVRVQGEIEWEKEQNLNDGDGFDTAGLFNHGSPQTSE